MGTRSGDLDPAVVPFWRGAEHGLTRFPNKILSKKEEEGMGAT